MKIYLGECGEETGKTLVFANFLNFEVRLVFGTILVYYFFFTNFFGKKFPFKIAYGLRKCLNLIA